jgi:putative transposase
MLEGEAALSLALLNEATQAWVEGEYQRRVHSELGTSPLERALAGPSRRAPEPRLRRAASRLPRQTTRAVRHSDGTFTVQGIRFELPGATAR